MKGLLFTLLVFLVSMALVSYIGVQRGLIYFAGEKLAVENRVNALLALYESIAKDGERALEIVGRRAITTAVGWIITNGKPLQEANVTIAELIINGTLNSTPQGLMENATLFDWKEKLQELAGMLGFDAKIEFGAITILPWDSWNLLAQVNASIAIADLRGIANLTRSQILSTKINIEGFEDPLYPLNTYGYVVNKIKKSPHQKIHAESLVNGTSGGNSWFYGLALIFYSNQSSAIAEVLNKSEKVLVTDNASAVINLANQFGAVVSESVVIDSINVSYVEGASAATQLIPNNTNILVDGDNWKVWRIENLREDANYSWHHVSGDGPSFLDRLEGKLAVQPKYNITGRLIGLESFVNKDEFTKFVAVDIDKTNVDYLYFSSATITAYRVKGMSESFRIDETHSRIYGIEEILI